MRAIILAAGRGERLRPLTDSLPKPLLAAGDKPRIIRYALEALARSGVREVVINLSWLGGHIRAALGDGAALGLEIRYSEEGPVPLEVGGGIFRALPWLGPGPFLVVNGDVWCDFDPAVLMAPEALDAEALGRLVLVPNPPQHPQGDFGLEGEDIVARDRDRYTYTGLGLYRPELFAGCEDGRFPLRPLLERAIAARRLRGTLHRGRWQDVGTAERLAALDAELRTARA